MALSNKIKGYAKKGYQVAFAKKSNAEAYARELKKHGYKWSWLRSRGSTVDRNPKGTKAYYMIPRKEKPKIKKIRKPTRRKSYNYGLRIPGL